MASDYSHLDGSVVLVTGPMASGKSTIVKALAATFPKGVYVEGDVFRRFIVSGRCEMTPEPSEEALAQLRLPLPAHGGGRRALCAHGIHRCGRGRGRGAAAQ